MKIERRDFLKKTGLLTAGGLMSGPLSIWTTVNQTLNRSAEAVSFLIRNAHIITMDEGLGDLKNSSLLVQNGKISQVGKNIAVPPDLEVINGGGLIVMPGLIDCHWHLWTSLLRSMAGNEEGKGYFPMTTRYSDLYTISDMEIAARYAAAEAVNSGVTTVSDYNHNARTPDYVMASCDALAEAGIRAQVLYGNYRDQDDSEPTHFEGIQSVLGKLHENEKYHLISLGLGSRGVGYKNLKSDWGKARELGLQITIHASSNESQKGQIQQLFNNNMLEKDVNIIHANAITNSEIEAVKETGASITMTPYSEMRIGYGFPQVNKLHEAGINLALGVDTTALSGNAGLFSTMKMIQNLANANAKDEFYMRPHEVLEMATINGARTLGMEKATGSLTLGKSADLIMLKKDELNFSVSEQDKHLLVEAARPQNVDFVAVNGRILKRNGQLTELDSEGIRKSAEKAFQRMHQELKH